MIFASSLGSLPDYTSCILFGETKKVGSIVLLPPSVTCIAINPQDDNTAAATCIAINPEDDNTVAFGMSDSSIIIYDRHSKKVLCPPHPFFLLYVNK